MELKKLLGFKPSSIKDLYRLLDRCRSDCEYFLGCGARCEKHLWGNSVANHIAIMRAIHEAVPEKPEWLTIADINKYEQRMSM